MFNFYKFNFQGTSICVYYILKSIHFLLHHMQLVPQFTEEPVSCFLVKVVSAAVPPAPAGQPALTNYLSS